MRAALALVSLLVCALACSFEASVPADAQLTCADDADCPATHRCVTSALRCLPNGLDVPQAKSITVDVDEDEPTVVLLDEDGRAARVITPPQHGTFAADGVARGTYTPERDFVGNDALEIVVADHGVTSAPAQIVLRVLPRNDAPVAQADDVTLAEDGVGAGVFRADDVDGDALVFDIAEQPTLGVVEIVEDALFLYFPAADANGVDAFSFTATDPAGATATATISVSINPVNDAPRFADLLPTLTGTTQDLAVVVDTQAFDPDGDDVELLVFDPPAHGALSVLDASQVRYTPEPAFVGSDAFEVTARDPFGAESTRAFPMSVLADDDFTDLGDQESCAAHLALGHGANGTYLVGDVATFCEMQSQGGGWTAVVRHDYASDACPGDLVHQDSPPGCIRAQIGSGARSASFAAPIPYTQVRVRLSGLAFGGPDAFLGPDLTIDDIYLDGISVTVGTPREHVWSFASGLLEAPVFSQNCQCAGGDPIAGPQTFIGRRFSCEAGDGAYVVDENLRTWGDDPLWDGAQTTGFCAVEEGGDDVVADLGAPHTDALEVRLMGDQESADEDVALTRLELFVR